MRSPEQQVREEPEGQLARRPALGYLAAVAGVALANVLLWLARNALDAAHASLLFLVVVLLVAYWVGSAPAVLAAVLSFLSWNYFHIQPTGTFYVHQANDLIALFVFLIVAVLTGNLAGRAREQAVAARERERETAMLYEISMASGGETHIDAVLPRLLERAVPASQADAVVVLQLDADGAPRAAAAHPEVAPESLDPSWRTRAAEVIRGGAPVGWDPPDDRRPIYLPLQAGDHIVGALLVAPAREPLSWHSRRLILAVAGHAAVALERQRLASEAAQAEALRAAEQFRGTLLSSVSHDLRTPLASIKAAVTSILHSERSHSPEARRELLQAVDEETDRLNAFVGALLDISRLEAGAWRPERDWFDLTEVLGTVLTRLDEPESRRVQVRIPPDLPLVPVDCVQFGQALWNLLENALKFSPPGTPVEVEAGVLEPEMLRITVADHGPGIAPGEEEHVFEKFYRVSGDRRPWGVPGTGLGLAIVRGIVEAHGGRVRAMNRPGGGALFEIVLPLRTPDLQLPAEYGEEPEEGEEANGG